MTLKINHLSKFNENKTGNIAVFLKSETKIIDLIKIFGKNKHLATSIEKLKKKENFTKKKFITSIDVGIEKKIAVPKAKAKFKPDTKLIQRGLVVTMNGEKLPF